MDNVNDVIVDLSDDTSTMSYDDYYYYSRQLDNIINNQNNVLFFVNIFSYRIFHGNHRIQIGS